jgi:hypothetical protein
MLTPRLRAQKRSMVKAALFTGVLLAGLGVLARALRKRR